MHLEKVEVMQYLSMNLIYYKGLPHESMRNSISPVNKGAVRESMLRSSTARGSCTVKLSMIFNYSSLPEKRMLSVRCKLKGSISKAVYGYLTLSKLGGKS